MSPIFSFSPYKETLFLGAWLALTGCADSGGAAGPSAGGGAGGDSQQLAGGGGGGGDEAEHGGASGGGSGGANGGANNGADGGAPANAGDGGASAGASGAPGGANEGGAAGDGGTSSAMAAVQAIFDERCISCHDATLTGLPSYPELPLTAGASYAALVNRRALQPCGGTRVVPGHPEQSYLVAKLAQDTPCDGGRMPQRYEPFLPFIALTDEQMATINDWISAGALP